MAMTMIANALILSRNAQTVVAKETCVLQETQLDAPAARRPAQIKNRNVPTPIVKVTKTTNARKTMLDALVNLQIAQMKNLNVPTPIVKATKTINVRKIMLDVLVTMDQSALTATTPSSALFVAIVQAPEVIPKILASVRV